MPKKGQIEPYPFANIDGKEEKVEGKIDLPDIDLPENLKQTRKKIGNGGVSVFGADMDIMTKKKLEARQFLNLGNRKPTDSIQTAYSSTNETESYRLDDDTLGLS